MTTMKKGYVRAMLLAVTLTTAACGGSGEPRVDTAAAAPSDGGAAAGTVTPDAGGRVITVEMETQPDGSNVFEPATIEAKRGDVIRYHLMTGVHNTHFLPDSNAGKSNLPAASSMLQLPGQTYDVKVTLAPGTYYFQCDPHALLGMMGHLTVTE